MDEKKDGLLTVRSNDWLGRFLIDGIEVSGHDLCRLFGFAENKAMVTAALISIEFQNGTIQIIET